MSRYTDQLPAHCHADKPRDLGAILAWDITCSQPQTVEETAWEVSYTIDGQRFSTLLSYEPGDTLPVRLSFY